MTLSERCLYAHCYYLMYGTGILTRGGALLPKAVLDIFLKVILRRSDYTDEAASHISLHKSA